MKSYLEHDLGRSKTSEKAILEELLVSEASNMSGKD